VSDCCLAPIGQYCIYNRTKTNYMSMRWAWYLVCTISTCFIGFA